MKQSAYQTRYPNTDIYVLYMYTLYSIHIRYNIYIHYTEYIVEEKLGVFVTDQRISHLAQQSERFTKLFILLRNTLYGCTIIVEKSIEYNINDYKLNRKIVSEYFHQKGGENQWPGTPMNNCVKHQQPKQKCSIF